MSDLHLELHKAIPPLTPTAEYLALCGDIGNPFESTYRKFLEIVSRLYKQVYLIAGNHEYYGNCFISTKQCIKDTVADLPNVHFLDNRAIGPVLEGGENTRQIRIFGTTLWSDTSNQPHIKSLINDYSRIYLESKLITPSFTLQEHLNSLEALKNEILYSKEHNYDLIVLSHFLPSYSCIHPIFKHYTNMHCAFASHLDYLIKDPIKLWVHGHSHKFTNVNINNIPVVCNPLGYPKEKSDYKDTFTIEI